MCKKMFRKIKGLQGMKYEKNKKSWLENCGCKIGYVKMGVKRACTHLRKKTLKCTKNESVFGWIKPWRGPYPLRYHSSIFRVMFCRFGVDFVEEIKCQVGERKSSKKPKTQNPVIHKQLTLDFIDWKWDEIFFLTRGFSGCIFLLGFAFPLLFYVSVSVYVYVLLI